MPSSLNRVALVVDDESFARLLAIQILLDAGYFVIEAETAAEGLEMLADNPDVSVLLTDISMPGALDGLGLVEEARRHHPELKIIVVSGLSQPPLDPDVCFLAKPYTATALLEALAQRPAEPGAVGAAAGGHVRC